MHPTANLLSHPIFRSLFCRCFHALIDFPVKIFVLRWVCQQLSVCLSVVSWRENSRKTSFFLTHKSEKGFFSCSSSKNLLTSFTGKTLRVSCCVFYSFKRSVNVLWTLAFIKKIPTNSSVFFQELFRFLSLFLAKLQSVHYFVIF